eukprot:TRINITY_DN13953_c0_g2_i2.p2 TRINITY_DN13953_c0_g2~~TRINITY_DN13953_c0_g2_i2.p2  ORF type:complete len:116 (+),score=19.86 TRINITY_DN13953_c0_g2_i2:44-391(+)
MPAAAIMPPVLIRAERGYAVTHSGLDDLSADMIERKVNWADDRGMCLEKFEILSAAGDMGSPGPGSPFEKPKAKKRKQRIRGHWLLAPSPRVYDEWERPGNPNLQEATCTGCIVL